ncbi:MAG: hypothetical protein VKP62_06450 [Candidatus Sericytochromatia bacterium]|nr:hypothetical protein [Candidatus Sericytochromatia bacterium]
MPKTDEELAALVADPEFAKFSAAQRAKILKDATKGRPPLVLQSSADPAPRPAQPAGRSFGDLLAADRQAKAARRWDPAAPARSTVTDELTAAVPFYGAMLPAPEAKAREQRLAQTPVPGSPASLARAAREAFTDVAGSGLTAQMLFGPTRQAIETAERKRRRTSPDLATRMAARNEELAALQPPLVTPAARDLTSRERAGAMLRGATQAAGEFVEGVAAPVRDVLQEPARLLPGSPGFAEGLTAAVTAVPTAMVTDPASDALFGGAGLAAARVAPALGAGLRGAREALSQAPTTLPTRRAPELDLTLGKAPDPATPVGAPEPPASVEKLSTPEAMPPLPPRPEVSLLIEDATKLQKSIPPVAANVGGPRRGSIGSLGRDPSEAFTPGQKAMNAAIDQKIRELLKERKQAELDGNAARITQIEAEVQGLDDARVVIPKPGGPVITIADLQNDLASATAAGDTATATRLERQIRQMRGSNYHNETKYSFLSDDARDKHLALLEQTVARLRAEGRDPRQRVPFDELRAKAADINPFAVEQMARKGLKRGESLTAAEYEAAKNYMQQLVEESILVEERVNAIQAAQSGGPVPNGADGNPIDPADLPQALTVETTRLMQLEKDVMGLQEIVTQSRSQKGRDLAYLKMVARQGFDVDYWLARANRTSGGVATSEQISTISQIVVRGQQADAQLKAAQAAGNASAEAAAREAVRQARIDLAKQMGRLTITPWIDALSTARKAGLLTGVKTIARNTASNTLNLGLEEIVSAIGAVPDAFLGMFTGNRTTFAPRVAGIARGINEAGSRGVTEALQTMVHGMPLDQLAALDIPREVNTPSNALNKYVNTIMRFQGAQDRIFKAYALRRSLDDQARSLVVSTARSTTPRLTRAQIEANIRRLADNPTEEMMFEAIADAEFATFQNETAISRAISGLKQGFKQYDAREGGSTGAYLTAGMDLFLPFVKTPASIGARVVADYATPFAVGQTLRKRSARRRLERVQGVTDGPWLTPTEQKALSKGLARNAMGSSLIWLGSRMYDEGRLTGSDQPDRREENTAAGRTPNAIKVGDEWLPLNPFSPVGTLLSLGATMNRDGRDLDGTTRGIKVGAQVLALILDQPFTQGAKQFVEVAGDTGGKKMNRFAGSLAGSVVPTIVAETAQFLDDSEEMRAVDYGALDSAVVQSVQNRLPLLREELPTAYTGLGDARGANTGWRAFSAGAGQFARENYDPVVREVLITGANLPRVSTDVQIKRKSAPIPLTVEEQQELLRRQGIAARNRIGKMLANPEYRAEESPDVQRERLNSAVTKASGQAKKRWIRENRQELLARQAQQDADDRIKRGRGRAVVGPLNTTP